MARVEPFHSIAQPLPQRRYHVCSKCTEGNNIEPQYKRPGTGGATMCENCQDRISKDIC